MIETRPGVCGGDPVIANTRISVRHLWRLFITLHWDVGRICQEYPQLTRSEVQEALRYAYTHPELHSDEN